MIRKILIICTGSILISIGINAFLLPFHIINGGAIGVSLILNYLLGLKVGVVIFGLNLPIYAFALLNNKKYFLNSLIGLICTSVIVQVLSPLSAYIHLPLWISAFLGGLLIGIGISVMVRQEACPGGIDLLAFLMSKKFKLNFGMVVLLFDGLIIVLGLLLLKDRGLLFSFVTIFGVALTTSILTSFKSIHFYPRMIK